jgi:hypothetical protein
MQFRGIIIIVKREIAEFGKRPDEPSENPSKTSMNRTPDFRKFPVIFPVLRESVHELFALS